LKHVLVSLKEAKQLMHGKKRKIGGQEGKIAVHGKDLRTRGKTKGVTLAAPELLGSGDKESGGRQNGRRQEKRPQRCPKSEKSHASPPTCQERNLGNTRRNNPHIKIQREGSNKTNVRQRGDGVSPGANVLNLNWSE